MPHSYITRRKVQTTTSFSSTKHNFPQLTNVCQPILSNVCGSLTSFYQRKPDNNMKHAGVHNSHLRK